MEKSLVLFIYFLFRLKSNNNRKNKMAKFRIFINRMQSIVVESNRIAVECNRIVIECNRKAIEHSSNQSQKTLENSIGSMIVRLIRSIENQSNDYIRLNSIDSEANRTSIAFD